MNTTNEIKKLISKVKELQKENEALQIHRYILFAEGKKATKERIDKLTEDFKIESSIIKIKELEKENQGLKESIQRLCTEPTEEEIDKVIEHFKND